MAINQYHLTVVPRQSIMRHWGVIPVKVQLRDNPSFDSFVDTVWDKEHVDFALVEKKILSFANKIEWTKEFEDGGTYGSNDTNDVSIYKNGQGHVTDFSFRIDLVQIDRFFINNILKISKDMDTLLLDKQGNLFVPTYENLLDNIKNVTHSSS